MKSTEHTNEVAYSISQLDNDMRRMLSVQFKEFIHHIEDNEVEFAVTPLRPMQTVTWMSMFDRYKIA